jgi:NADH:ubiquinone oxidoreductase subunit 6 (subunit J)
MSSAAFVLIGILTLAAALAAATLQKLMHATLSFAVALVGVAALFVLLGAEFVGLVLVFVYIGAVAVLTGVVHFLQLAYSGVWCGQFLGRNRFPLSPHTFEH